MEKWDNIDTVDYIGTSDYIDNEVRSRSRYNYDP
jgi:hypothetical protein